ncbi:hypothetical protein, partial [Hymenobacter glacialis]|uniref:hypothetical protein n=1 Tax=Hymenobacter glacialis TaxID=1908236 RepID=UPI0019D37D94
PRCAYGTAFTGGRVGRRQPYIPQCLPLSPAAGIRFYTNPPQKNFIQGDISVPSYLSFLFA